MKITLEGNGENVLSSRHKLELMIADMEDGQVFANSKMKKVTGMTKAAARNLRDTNNPHFIMYKGSICWANLATVAWIKEDQSK